MWNQKRKEKNEYKNKENRKTTSTQTARRTKLHPQSENFPQGEV